MTGFGARGFWLFDLDGTLVDSLPAHAAAFRRALAEQAPGRARSFRYAEIAGLPTLDAAARLVEGPAAAGRLARRKQELYRDGAARGEVVLLPGARNLLDRLRADGRRVHLVTAGSRGSVERVLTACGIQEAFDGIITAEDVPVGKPDPGFYREACRRWGADPGEAVAVEDSAAGVASAVGAGLLVLHVHTGNAAPGAIAVPGLDALTALLGEEVRGAG
ncbi:HAD family phosphatase [Actinocorallia longicatena]|uniref:HAD-IA family hydrolase n=1 Tax=Actinocorallia longicatena TaxID=111803 RepID=A0ABP6QAX3_9ACTN